VDGANTPTDAVGLGSDTLYAVIAVVSSSPDLDRVLGGVVDVLTQATQCHACFVYLLHGERLRLRAASRPFAHLVGRVEFGRDEGVAGWVVRNRHPEFIREGALADPRMKYVPEMQEERFQSSRRASSTRASSRCSTTPRRSWPARSRTPSSTRPRAGASTAWPSSPR
jgi:transcriptional regulator with GAF, ATPase, and Fis domain